MASAEDKKGPHKIVDLVQDIIRHPSYQTLNKFEKIEVEMCTPGDTPFHKELYDKRSKHQVSEDNAFLRNMWRHLYNGEKNPCQ